jgi:hypothetical protein
MTPHSAELQPFASGGCLNPRECPARGGAVAGDNDEAIDVTGVVTAKGSVSGTRS